MDTRSLKLFRITRYAFDVESIIVCLILLIGFYDISFWFYGVIFVLLPFVVIFYMLLVANFIYYSQMPAVKIKLKKAVFINSLFFIPVIVLIIYLLINPINIPIG